MAREGGRSDKIGSSSLMCWCQRIFACCVWRGIVRVVVERIGWRPYACPNSNPITDANANANAGLGFRPSCSGSLLARNPKSA